MAKIFIASLGSGQYSPTCYKLGDNFKKACLLPSELLIEVIQPDKTYLLGTDKSAWNLADERLGKGNYQRITVPWGTHEEEWWKILENLTSIEMKPGDEIYMDITHSFRSLPLFTFVGVFYFERFFHARSRGIYYGMFENRTTEILEGTETEVTSVVDLSIIIHLMDWIDAYTLFQNMGDAHFLAFLLEEEGKRHNMEDSMRWFVADLHRISNCFGLNYVREIGDISAGFRDRREEILTEMSRLGEPASLIKESILEELSRFATPAQEDEFPSHLHLRLLRWYLSRRRFAQFMLLAGETLLTFLVENLDRDKVYELDFREKVRTGLTVNKNAKTRFPLLKKFFAFSNKIGLLRNMTGHAQMRDTNQGVIPSDTADRKCQKYLEDIEKFINGEELREYINENRREMLRFISDEWVTIDIGELFAPDQTALMEKIGEYMEKLKNNYDFEGRAVRLTGRGPIWLYLYVAHFLHGHVQKLEYYSPVTQNMMIYDHTS